MPHKWTAESDQKLLLCVLELGIDYQKVSKLYNEKYGKSSQYHSPSMHSLLTLLRRFRHRSRGRAASPETEEQDRQRRGIQPRQVSCG
jgi:hypothetical protein